MLDEELDSCIDKYTEKTIKSYGEMIRYQLGWNGFEFEKSLSGKRLRPIILLLTTHASGGNWQEALPAAAAVELVHNFSLVHDDIQDKSDKRRGRDTVWVKWGEAQAINTGDALLALAILELLSMQAQQESRHVLGAVHILNQATFDLTKGQFLDLTHEKVEDVSLQYYFEMVEGKTGALFSACFAIGALLSGKEDSEIQKYLALGRKLGIAFQIQDDHLGIWGHDEATGKSSEGDLVSRKKTFPVHYALENLPDVRKFWIEHTVFDSEDVLLLKEKLENAGVDEITLNAASRYYAESIEDFKALFTDTQRSVELMQLIEGLFSRVS